MDLSPIATVDDYGPGVQTALAPEFVDQDASISQQAAQDLNAFQPYNNTLFYAASPGWSVQYTFVGTYIGVFGVFLPWISGDLPVAHYAVDGDFQEIRANPNISGQLDINAPFYEIDNLAPSQHTLTVNITRASPDGPWVFDYLRVAVVQESSETGSPTSASSSISTISTTSTSTSASTTPPASETPLSATSAAVTSQTTSSGESTSLQGNQTNSGSLAATASVATAHPDGAQFPTAPVVGAIAGGVVLIAAVLALVYYFWKRSRRASVDSYEHARKQDEDDSERPQGPRHASDNNMLPAMESSKEYEAGYGTLAARFNHTPPPHSSGYSTWSPDFAHQRSQSETYPLSWTHQNSSSPDVRAQTMYSSSSSIPWEQWSSYSPPPGWGQSGPYPPPAMHMEAPARTSAEHVQRVAVAVVGAAPVQEPAPYAALQAAAGARPSTPLGLASSEDANPSGSVVPTFDPQHRAPSALSLVAHDGPLTGSTVDLAPPRADNSTRMLGGVITYDGKESRLTTVTARNIDTASPGGGSGGCTSPSGAPPPAYIP
ncbi:hypothetical protein C8Q77DRAFT_490976 [Trametes polyzona]|nr:hypothetical protein C8Q77DRAFT_490976 [Trametes polyzona]